MININVLLVGEDQAFLMLYYTLGGCPFKPDEVRNITWPATNTSTTARQKCPGNGEAESTYIEMCGCKLRT